MGKFNNYKSNEKKILLLPYPAEGCNCEFFSYIFDNYGNDVKKSLLLNTMTDKYETQIYWNWPDWNYIGDNSKNKTQPMKQIIVLHFARVIYVKKKSRYKSSKYFGECKGKGSFSKHDFVCMA